MSVNVNTILDEFVNHYKILGISQDSSQKDIRLAYKNLCLIYHPDKNTGNAEIFEQINDSYLVLKDPVLKQQYDLSLNTNNDQIDFAKLRNNYTEYIKTYSNLIPKIDETELKPINVREIDSKLEKSALDDLNLIREQDDLENLPDKLFNSDDDFNMNSFNKNFDNFKQNYGDHDKHTVDAYHDLFSGSCRATDLNETFNQFAQENKNSRKNDFLDQFTLVNDIQGTRNTTNVLDKSYFEKMMKERDSILDNIEYSTTIVDGVDYRAIGFL